MFSVAEAARKLGKDPKTVIAWCRAGKIKATEVPDKRKGIRFEIDDDSIKELRRAQKDGEGFVKRYKENEDKKTAASESNLENLILALHLSVEQGERLKATLKGFSKSNAETVLKAEQAFSKQKENLLAAGNFVEINVLQAEFESVYSVLARNFRDCLQSWIAEFKLSPQQGQRMKSDYEAAMKRAFEDLRSLAHAPGAH